MLRLNEDCLIKLCKYLDFADVVSLQETCVKLHRVIIDNILGRMFRVFFPHLVPLNPQDKFLFVNVIHWIAPHIEKLHLHPKHPHNIMSYKFYITIKYDTLRVITCTDLQLNDSDMKLIATNCPNVVSIRLDSTNISGKHILLMGKLKKLHVRGAIIKTLLLNRILKNLSLTHLALGSHVKFNKKTFPNSVSKPTHSANSLEQLACDFSSFDSIESFLNLYKCKKLQKIYLTATYWYRDQTHSYACRSGDLKLYNKTRFQLYNHIKDDRKPRTRTFRTMKKLDNILTVNTLNDFTKHKNSYGYLNIDKLIELLIQEHEKYDREITFSGFYLHWNFEVLFKRLLEALQDNKSNVKLLVYTHSGYYSNFVKTVQNTKLYQKQDLVELNICPDLYVDNWAVNLLDSFNVPFVEINLSR